MKTRFFKRAAAFAAVLMAVVTSGICVNAEAADGVEVNSENFPDDVFRQYVLDNFDKNSDGFLSDEEINKTTSIVIQNSGMQSLEGIEYFTELTTLFCNNNQLTSLDLSNNTMLDYLYSSYNQLTSLDVSKNTALTNLYCEDNQLTSLDVSNNTVLTELACDKNPLISLDVSPNTALTYLNCGSNQLTSLDISQNTALEFLYCGGNQLTSLDISNNTALTSLSCGDNQFTSLDVSNNTALTSLYCDYNQLTTLDVSKNTALTNLDCYSNSLTLLDVSNNTALKDLRCGINKLTSLDVSNNPLLTKFECSYNSYSIGETCGAYDLKNLPTGFDLTKASNWQGAVLNGDMLTEFEEGTGTITYDYDCGNNHTATFNLTYNYVGSGNGGGETTDPTNPTQPTQPTQPTNPTNPTNPTEPSQPTTPTTPTNPTNPTTPQQPAENEPETIISAKNGWGNVVKEINGANDNSKINVDMGNATEVPKNVMNAVKGKNVDIVLDMGDGITWTINGQDVTDPQSLDFSVTKKKNVIPKDVMDKVADTEDTVQLVLGHNGNFGCSATLSIDLGNNNSKKIANLYYYNTKTKELEFVDSGEIVNGKANLVFTHASDWAIVISDEAVGYEDVSSGAGIYEVDDNSQAPLCMIVIIITAVGFSSIIIVKRFAKNKR